MITRTCTYCGKEYETYPSVKPKYCSMECAGKAKKTGEYVPCEQCGTLFWRYASKPDRRYCSLSCATTARNLTNANPAYHRDITGENNPMYGKGLSGEDNPMYGHTKSKAPRWSGGKKIRKDGYIMIVVDDSHPRPSYTKASGTKYLLEHRYVMEHHLGRYLDPDEVVHHKDGNESNNAIENLELFANQSEHISVAHS
jgi:hypothetical protein